MMKKVVLKCHLHDDKAKNKAMKILSGLSGIGFRGIDSISMDMKDKKMTVTGDVDPVMVIYKLRKICVTEIVSVGPAKEAKKEEAKTEGKKISKDECWAEHFGHHLAAYHSPPPRPAPKAPPSPPVRPPLPLARIKVPKPPLLVHEGMEEEKTEGKKISKDEEVPEVLRFAVSYHKSNESKLPKNVKSKDELPEYVKAYYAYNPHMRKVEDPVAELEDPVAELAKSYKAYNPHRSKYYLFRVLVKIQMAV